jgi:hypothetical protein
MIILAGFGAAGGHDPISFLSRKSKVLHDL